MYARVSGSTPHPYLLYSTAGLSPKSLFKVFPTFLGLFSCL